MCLINFCNMAFGTSLQNLWVQKEKNSFIVTSIHTEQL